MKSRWKQAWLDEKNKIVSFHCIEDSRVYRAEETHFWDYIMGLTRSGYRIQ
ncbi:MAG: hypothetical protein MJ077_12230 [Oscillospiraceae bacterium]|nr:hypothetical protein [Oscillospiraceae bacterium]